jgi:hypothetical protein
MLSMCDKETLELIVKKWEIYWNHYKLQEESLEKRRNFLWIIQSFALGGYFYILSNIGLKIDRNIREYFIIILIIVSFIGILFSIILKFALKRHSRSQKITEMALRDIEYQFNIISNKMFTNKLPSDYKLLINYISNRNYINRFILDKEILFNNISHTWPYNRETLKKEIIPSKYKSQGFWLNKFLPVLFLIVWIILLFIAIFIKYPQMSF